MLYRNGYKYFHFDVHHLSIVGSWMKDEWMKNEDQPNDSISLTTILSSTSTTSGDVPMTSCTILQHTDDRWPVIDDFSTSISSAICHLQNTDDRCLHNKHFIFTFVASNIINLSYYSVSNLATSITCSPPLLFSLHCSLLRYWAKVSSVTTWNPNTVRSIGHIWKSKTINVEVWHNLESTFQLDHAPYFWLTMYST